MVSYRIVWPSGDRRPSKVSVDKKGKVVSATSAFEWAVGQGMHVVLSWASRRGLRWERLDPQQLELRL